jgi:hypothetical protein
MTTRSLAAGARWVLARGGSGRGVGAGVSVSGGGGCVGGDRGIGDGGKRCRMIEGCRWGSTAAAAALSQYHRQRPQVGGAIARIPWGGGGAVSGDVLRLVGLTRHAGTYTGRAAPVQRMGPPRQNESRENEPRKESRGHKVERLRKLKIEHDVNMAKKSAREEIEREAGLAQPRTQTCTSMHAPLVQNATPPDPHYSESTRISKPCFQRHGARSK